MAELFQRRRTKVSVPAVSDIVTVDQAKSHAILFHDQFDSDIHRYIKVAAQFAEDDAWRAFLTQTWITKLDEFPENGCPILLPRPPLQSVSSITYLDENGDLQTLSSSLYQVDTHSEPGIILPVPNGTWPSTETGRLNAVSITYVAGYADSPEVLTFPKQITQAVLYLVAWMIDRRAPISLIPGIVLQPIPLTYEDQIGHLRFRDYRILDFA